MTPFYEDPLVTLYLGDCLDVMRELPDASVDSVVTDPPYGLEFMGKEWDNLGLKRGRHVGTERKFFGEDGEGKHPAERAPGFGSQTLNPKCATCGLYQYGPTPEAAAKRGRTHHKCICETPDFRRRSLAPMQQAWHEQWATEAFRVLKPGGYLLAFGGTRTYHRLASAIEDAGFEIRDTLMWIYACLSDDTELLTREHGWVQYNRANEGDHAAAFDPDTGELRWERIEAVHQYDHAGSMVEVGPSLVTLNHRVVLDAETARVPRLPRLWDELPASVGMGEAGRVASLLPSMQREAADSGPSIPTGPGVEPRKAASVTREDDGLRESGLEGRRYRVQEARELLWGPIRASTGVGAPDGPSRRVRDGASSPVGRVVRLLAHALGVRQPREPRPDRQPPREPDAVAGQSDAQAIRVGEGDRGDGLPTGDTPRLVVGYAGVVWCITVPSGAFVARRGGVTFVTGNSGFPKSLDVSKALDKVAGAEREVTGTREVWGLGATRFADKDTPVDGDTSIPVTAPATDLARKWEGWGTALKPAHEPIVMARKPLVGTVAANVTRYGTGAINVDGCRIGTTVETWPKSRSYGPGQIQPGGVGETQDTGPVPAGRWPSNVLLSDPELFDEPNPGVVGSGATSQSTVGNGQSNDPWLGGGKWDGENTYGDSGGYSRFFRIPGEESSRLHAHASADATPTVGDPHTPVSAWPGVTSPPSAAQEDSNTYPKAFIIPKADRAERERGLVGTESPAIAFGNNVCRNCGHGQFDGRRDGPCCDSPDYAPGQVRARANMHPTVKPIDLMRHLVRLVTPPGGVCLDPFLGSGTTSLAASEEGFRCIGIEREAEYLEIAKGRLIATPMGLGLE